MSVLTTGGVTAGEVCCQELQEGGMKNSIKMFQVAPAETRWMKQCIDGSGPKRTGDVHTPNRKHRYRDQTKKKKSEEE